MRKIYFFDEYISSQKNGIGTYLRELLYCLKSPEHNICLIIFNADTEEFNIVEGKDHKKLLFPVMKGHFLHQIDVIDKFLRLYIEDEPGNIFFVNHSPCRSLIESLKTNFPKSKVVFTIHDFGWTNPFMGNLKKYRDFIRNKLSDINEKKGINEDFILNSYKEDKEMYQLADRVVCLSQDSYSTLHSLYELNNNKVSFIPNGLRDTNNVLKQNNVEEIRESLNIRNDEKIIITIGRPTKQKGIFALMEAMRLVLETHQDVRLVIIGDANEQSFRDLIQAKSVHPVSITFTGLLDRFNIYKWLSIANIGAISSYYEQCSFVGIEMMMSGIPIVASNGIGVRNMFQDNVNGLVAKIGNRNQPKEYVKNMAKAIIRLLDSPDLCNRLSIGARKTYEDKYIISYMKSNYKKLIESL